jgi:hypothetical protein
MSTRCQRDFDQRLASPDVDAPVPILPRSLPEDDEGGKRQTGQLGGRRNRRRAVNGSGNEVWSAPGSPHATKHVRHRSFRPHPSRRTSRCCQTDKPERSSDDRSDGFPSPPPTVGSFPVPWNRGAPPPGCPLGWRHPFGLAGSGRGAPEDCIRQARGLGLSGSNRSTALAGTPEESGFSICASQIGSMQG